MSLMGRSLINSSTSIKLPPCNPILTLVLLPLAAAAPLRLRLQQRTSSSGSTSTSPVPCKQRRERPASSFYLCKRRHPRRHQSDNRLGSFSSPSCSAPTALQLNLRCVPASSSSACAAATPLLTAVVSLQQPAARPRAESLRQRPPGYAGRPSSIFIVLAFMPTKVPASEMFKSSAPCPPLLASSWTLQTPPCSRSPTASPTFQQARLVPVRVQPRPRC
jgi:hypothetical protein